MEISHDDVRARLPEEVLRAHHPEVTIRYDGVRTISDPAFEWFEATGKGAGRTKCRGSNAEEKCRVFAERYETMKAEARRLIREKAQADD